MTEFTLSTFVETPATSLETTSTRFAWCTVSMKWVATPIGDADPSLAYV